MHSIRTFQVFPKIPPSLEFLETLAFNMWWCWKKDAIELFRRIEPKLWQESGHNPWLLFSRLPQTRLNELAENESFLAHLDRVKESYRHRVLTPANAHNSPFKENETIAYLSMEFGIHESIPLFAGGLGILAGDHLKSSSNMAIPLTGIGLLYRQGYFRQYLDTEGMQQEEYPNTDYYHLPIERAVDRQGNDLRVTVEGPQGDIHADVWKIQVGCVSLYLLDANIQENPSNIRNVTDRLYSGDPSTRLSQEILLGVGGLRALKAMGLYPKVCHMNEGHSAFCSLERLAQIIERYDVDLKTAMEIVPRTMVFTTHTPVPAGHDEFSPDLVRPVLSKLKERLGTTEDRILSWGRTEGEGLYAPLSMFVLGMHMSQHCNGVSKLHGRTARKMWSHIWPNISEEEVPISHVTNGIHVSSFISLEFAQLFDRYLGPDWYMSSRKPENIDRIDQIYDEELWRAHDLNRSRLIRTCRHQLVKQYARRNAPQAVIEEAGSVLNDNALTIGFARRFASYKRAYLFMKDPDRLLKIINSPTHPVQFIFAGKAHPRDQEGKDLIKHLIQFARKPEVRNRIVFLEDYDLHLARHIYQGVDVWLNTPRRPFEACGTSGMKAAVNGAINLSILDGWWCEGFSSETGYAIGQGEEFQDWDYQDDIESQALYNILENDVIPCFYDRKQSGLSACWMRMMKASMKMAMENFCSMRMVADYQERYYFPAARRMDELVANNAEEARKIASQVQRLRSFWGQIGIEPPVREKRGHFRVGERFRVSTLVHLGELRPDEVDVELYYGPMESFNQMHEGKSVTMTVEEDQGDGRFLYGCQVDCQQAGRFGFTARVTPHGDGRMKTTPNLITWS
jgi:starch phosphorylase